MRVSHSAAFEATLDEVYAMLTDPGFREHAAAAVGATSVEVTVEHGGAGCAVTVDMVQPTEGVPSFARKFAGQTTRVIQVESWSSPAEATVTVSTPGRPTELRGGYRLVVEGSLTTQHFEGELKVKVPLIKDKLERLMAQLYVEGRDREQAAGAAWLAGAEQGEGGRR
jgi:hypothetical protein